MDPVERTTIEQRLVETGEKERLKEHLRNRLIESGWREELKLEAKQVNTLLKSLRDKYIGALQVAMSPSTARVEVSRLCAAIVRTLFGKTLVVDMGWAGISPVWELQQAQAQSN